MKQGQYFLRDQSRWIAKEIVIEENKRFTWLKVKAIWSGIGPMPNWHKELRTFLMFRRRKCDGSLV